jgi:hypothetical protein
MTSYKVDKKRQDTAVKLPSKIPGWQLLWAGWMQRQSERLSRGGKITIWFMFSLLAGGYSSWLIIGGVSGKLTNPFTVTPIRAPAYATSTVQTGNAMISSQEFERIHRFRLYMDSLYVSTEGKARYEMIVGQRPGLIDSVRTIEELYQAQIGKQ